jgi:hypothetical protein
MTEQRALARAPTHAPGPQLFVPEGAEGFTLAQAVAPGQHIETLCLCGERAEFDARAWLDRGLGFQALQDFSGRLRCRCGGRQAWFEVWPGEPGTSGLKVRSAAELYD